MDEKYCIYGNVVGYINYKFVFCSRYRRKIFLNKEVQYSFKKINSKVCNSLGITILKVECQNDYVLMHLISPPNLSPKDIMSKIKGKSSKLLREDFKELSHLNSLWTRNYLVSTEDNVSYDDIQNYINEQKKRG